MVRLEMDRVEDGQLIEAEVSRHRFEELALSRGDKVYVSPRSARIFPR
jgi:sulfate transport system ATP-binding protein